MNIDKDLSKGKIEELLDRSITEEEYKEIVSTILYQLLDECKQENE
ncbi:hypothetical protein [Paenibacillus sp. ISL-20]|nr:hypothetical protein [Paenibacillus sp. ISL-20]MBT2760009.1 hypothetical protein [Paenibacillus sp. ISL-20]